MVSGTAEPLVKPLSEQAVLAMEVVSWALQAVIAQHEQSLGAQRVGADYQVREGGLQPQYVLVLALEPTMASWRVVAGPVLN